MQWLIISWVHDEEEAPWGELLMRYVPCCPSRKRIHIGPQEGREGVLFNDVDVIMICAFIFICRSVRCSIMTHGLCINFYSQKQEVHPMQMPHVVPTPYARHYCHAQSLIMHDSCIHSYLEREVHSMQMPHMAPAPYARQNLPCAQSWLIICALIFICRQARSAFDTDASRGACTLCLHLMLYNPAVCSWIFLQEREVHPMQMPHMVPAPYAWQ